METYPQTRWTLTALLEAPSGEPRYVFFIVVERGGRCKR